MNLYFKLMFFTVLASCTVTNSIYVNDPIPLERKDFEGQIGLGTGHQAVVEDVDAEGNISFSNDFTTAPNLFFSGRYGISDQWGLRFAMHLPYVVAGLGMRAGTQYSFFPASAAVNMAFGADVGFVVAKDSLHILGSASPLNAHSNGAWHSDLFLPVSYKFSNNFRLILTGRYSFTTIYIRENIHYTNAIPFFVRLPSLALGGRWGKFQFESSFTYFQNSYVPNFGVVYFPVLR